MAKDSQHQKLTFKSSEMTHHYGKNVHILSSPMMLSLLAKLGHPETKQPQINELVETLYSHLFDVVVDEFFPRKNVTADTRMKSSHSEGTYEGEIIDPENPVVVVDLARAGTWPSHVCYHKLNVFMNPDKIRQDHFYIARATDASGKVTGADISGSKIGGDVEDAIVILPDPMGATGGSIAEVYNHYKKNVGGKPRMIIAMHLMITPEYLKRVTTSCPDLKVFALRLDRGLSPENILKEEPGKNWSQEIGLNQHQYIIPGAGGLGEILNNSYC